MLLTKGNTPHTAFVKYVYLSLAQVLSETVSKALVLTGGSKAEETAHFVNIFDKFV